MSGTACQCQETAYAEIEIDYNLLDKIIHDDYGGNKEAMIMMMQAIQRVYRFLPEAAVNYLSQVIEVPLTKIYEVATFYASFSLEPKGKYILSVCTGTACHLKGSGGMVEHISKRMGIAPGKTTADLKLTLETVNCVGACAVAPVVVVDEKYYPKADIATLNDFMDRLNAE
jgi:NADH:ubiquinone oxidoreductase subunit E